MKRNSTVIVVGIILIVLLVVFFALIASGAIGSGGNKVTVMGTVSYNMIGGWSVSYSSHLVEPDGLLSVLFYWPWETKDINIKVQLSGSDGVYNGETWAGTLSSITGSKSFSAEVRHVPSGSYSGKILVYEVEKGLLGWGESTRNLKATGSFSLTIS